MSNTTVIIKNNTVTPKNPLKMHLTSVDKYKKLYDLYVSTQTILLERNFATEITSLYITIVNPLYINCNEIDLSDKFIFKEADTKNNVFTLSILNELGVEIATFEEIVTHNIKPIIQSKTKYVLKIDLNFNFSGYNNTNLVFSVTDFKLNSHPFKICKSLPNCTNFCGNISFC